MHVCHCKFFDNQEDVTHMLHEVKKKKHKKPPKTSQFR